MFKKIVDFFYLIFRALHYLASALRTILRIFR